MLTLSRKPGQSIIIGKNIIVTVKDLRGRTVRLSVEAPGGMPIYREELHAEIEAENRRAAQSLNQLDSRFNDSAAVLSIGKAPEKG
jgi:carbon storage regulator